MRMAGGIGVAASSVPGCDSRTGTPGDGIPLCFGIGGTEDRGDRSPPSSRRLIFLGLFLNGEGRGREHFGIDEEIELY